MNSRLGHTQGVQNTFFYPCFSLNPSFKEFKAINPAHPWEEAAAATKNK
jgi:hypothetical protein